MSAAGAFAENGCWTRVRFQKTNGGKALQLSEFALYNWQGERVNSPLTVVADGHRANLGSYGNTPWATLSKKEGFFLMLR